VRITKAGKRNLQDWNDADHAAHGHAFVAEPLFLALCNVRSSLANLEVAAGALEKLQSEVKRLRERVSELEGTLEALKEQVTQ
jgi:hypothetical protein